MQNRPRLLVLASTYPRWKDDSEPGFVHELSRRLSGEFEVSVLCPHAPGSAAEESMDGVRVHRYRYAPGHWERLAYGGGIVTNLRRSAWRWLLLPSFIAAQAWATWRLVLRTRPQVVHAHWLIPQGLVLAVLRLLDPRMPPFVVTSHGADLFSLRGWLPRKLKSFVCRSADSITVVSSAMVGPVLELGVERAKLSVEPMGVDLEDRFVPVEGESPEQGRMLFVGRLVEKKGLEHLIAALPGVISALPHARLSVVGFGPEESKLKSQVAELGLHEFVDFHGAATQAELPGFYRWAHLFVAPFVEAAGGDQEGLGLVLVEAAGCGCPVLAGDVVAVHDVIRSGDVGAIVTPTDHEALAAAIIRQLSQPRCRDADQVRASAVSGFNWSRRAAAYRKLLARAAGEAKR